ncbi:MAG TPA: SBBP repeat-containing protein [Bryobacteraceae bacterium]|jgi:sugar lactone lactonase YvrE
MRKFIALFLLSAARIWAQGTISTVVGTDFSFPPTPVQAQAAPTGAAAGLAIDSAGNLYVSDMSNSLVFKVDNQGILTVVAGNGIAGFSGDGGPATNASFNSPRGIAVDPAGNLLIADTGNNRVRKVGLDGVVTTIAGNGMASFSGDGRPAGWAGLYAPCAVTVDAAGVIYVADTLNYRIRKISPDGLITTIAGNGRYFGQQDGVPATSSGLYNPTGITLDGQGNLYIAGDSSIRKVTSDGQITSIAAVPLVNQLCSGISQGVVLDNAGNIFLTNVCSQVVQITPSGQRQVIAGRGRPGFAGDGGPALGAALFQPLGICIDPAGNLLVADTVNNRVRRVDSAGKIGTIIGNGGYRFGGDGGDAAAAYLWSPQAIAIDSAGGIYIADTWNNRIRYVTPDGTIETIAGTGAFLFSGDGGPAIVATLSRPLGVAVDSSGDVFIADSGSSRTREVFLSGVINTVLGGGSTVATDSADNVFVANAQFVYELTPAGVSIPIAGFGSDAGDGGRAVNAEMGYITGLAIDTSGNLFISDLGTSRVRKVTPDGIITTAAGNGQPGYSGDGGPATDASLFGLGGIAVDAGGNLYIADSGNHRVRKVGPDGMISTVAGTGHPGFSGDGGASTGATLNNPQAVAIDSWGNLYIADSGNNRIRKVQP